jgi:hypothetical protein
LQKYKIVAKTSKSGLGRPDMIMPGKIKDPGHEYEEKTRQ